MLEGALSVLPNHARFAHFRPIYTVYLHSWSQGLAVTQPECAPHVHLAVDRRVFIPDMDRLQDFQLGFVTAAGQYCGIIHQVRSR